MQNYLEVVSSRVLQEVIRFDVLGAYNSIAEVLRVRLRPL